MNKRYCNGMVHVIKQGETLYQLSRRYRVPLALILRANPYVDVYNLQVGQEICIPVTRPFNGMVCMPVHQRNDGNPRMMDNRQGQMPDGNEQEMSGQMPEGQMAPRMEQQPEREQSAPSGQMMSQSWDGEDSCPCGSQPETVEKMDQDCDDDEVEVYVTSGDKSLGEILREFDVDLDDFAEKNDLGQIAICEDVVLYLPKKHKNSRG